MTKIRFKIRTKLLYVVNVLIAIAHRIRFWAYVGNSAFKVLVKKVHHVIEANRDNKLTIKGTGKRKNNSQLRKRKSNTREKLTAL